MEKMQDYFILFWWWENEEYCCKCVKCEMLVRHLSRDIKQTTRSDHIILLLETLHWLPTKQKAQRLSLRFQKTSG